MIADRYRLDREIARGGMGAVWLGTDEVLGRPVALKRIGLLPGAAAPDLARATREARLAAALHHPNVVAVFDQVTEGDDHWLVMEYVEGSTLADLVKEGGPMTPDQVAPLLRQTAEALTAAHEAGIVHRDVKPSNVLVTPDGQVKLTDFGIARLENDPTLTQTGLVTGSPAYLAPEVASGRPATDASDVWALGASLFHALAGRPPYDVGDNLMGALYRIVHEEPPRLEDAGWLAPVLEATMVTDPAQRWPMSRVADYLRAGPDAAPQAVTAVLPATPAEPTAVVPPVPSTATPRARTTTPRSPRPVWPWLAGAAALLMVLVLALSLSGDGDDPGRDTRPSQEPSQSQTSSDSEPEGSEEPTDAETPDAAAMEAFISEYLAMVTTDRRTTWTMLTPAFQEKSGGYGKYQRWWRSVETLQVTDMEADPEASTVTYTVDYDMVDGSERTNVVTLTLVESDGGFLIDDERLGR